MTVKSQKPGKGIMAGLLAGLLLFVFFYFLLNIGTQEDAFISFRYAENLASGKGLVFNKGEREEGYSNFLWVILLAAGRTLGAPVNVTAKVLGLISALITLILVFRLERQLSGRYDFFTLVPMLLLASCFPYSNWSYTGLETPFYVLLLVAGAYGLIRAGHKGQPVHGLFYLLLAALTRPEGVAYLCLALVYILWRPLLALIKGDKRALLSCIQRRDLALIIAVIALFLGYHVWHYSYFGHLLPNSFYSKTSVHKLHDMSKGLEYLAYNGVKLNLHWLLLVMLPALALGLRKFNALLLMFVGFNIFYTIYVGGDYLPFSRFMLPSLPFLFLLFVRALRLYPKMIRASIVRPSRLRLAAMFLSCALIIGNYGYTNHVHWLVGGRIYWQWTKILLKQPTVIIDKLKVWLIDPAEYHPFALFGLWLKEQFPGDNVIASEGCGAMAYYSKHRYLDFAGLMRRDIALNMHGNYGLKSFSDHKYILRQEPDVILGLEGLDLFSSDYFLGFYADPEFHAHYRPYKAIYIDHYFDPTRDLYRLMWIVFVRGRGMPNLPKDYISYLRTFAEDKENTVIIRSVSPDYETLKLLVE